MRNLILGCALFAVIAQGIWLQFLRRQIVQLRDLTDSLQQVQQVIVITTCGEESKQNPTWQ